jgi:gluconate 2-dehydrogenase gamma chain
MEELVRDADERPEEAADGLTRRMLIRRAGILAASAGVAGALAACGAEEEAAPRQVSGDVDAREFPPLPPRQAPALCTVLAFFDADEARAVEAIVARLIPGTPDDPGAREACVPTYIDQKLASFPSFATPTYFHKPFAKPAPGPQPPQEDARDVITVAEKELPRYGFQSDLTPQQAYRLGLAELDRYARGRYGAPFADLDEKTQDEILGDLEDDKVESFTKPSGGDFFAMLQEDANEGMFADPIYGGNRDLAGWKLIGYPGAQRAYTPEELKNGTTRRPQGLRDMPPMHPGRPQDHAILPLAGTRRTERG